jgi:hypothetical protein
VFFGPRYLGNGKRQRFDVCGAQVTRVGQSNGLVTSCLLRHVEVETASGYSWQWQSRQCFSIVIFRKRKEMAGLSQRSTDRKTFVSVINVDVGRVLWLRPLPKPLSISVRDATFRKRLQLHGLRERNTESKWACDVTVKQRYRHWLFNVCTRHKIDSHVGV